MSGLVDRGELGQEREGERGKEVGKEGDESKETRGQEEMWAQREMEGQGRKNRGKLEDREGEKSKR